MPCTFRFEVAKYLRQQGFTIISHRHSIAFNGYLLSFDDTLEYVQVFCLQSFWCSAFFPYSSGEEILRKMRRFFPHTIHWLHRNTHSLYLPQHLLSLHKQKKRSKSQNNKTA